MPRTKMDGWEIYDLGAAPSGWQCAFHPSMREAAMGKRLINALASFDVNLLENMRTDLFHLVLVDTPQPYMTVAELRDKISKDQFRSRRVIIAHEDPYLVDDDVTTHSDADESSDPLILQAKWLYDVARGKDINEAIRKWELVYPEEKQVSEMTLQQAHPSSVASHTATSKPKADLHPVTINTSAVVPGSPDQVENAIDEARVEIPPIAAELGVVDVGEEEKEIDTPSEATTHLAGGASSLLPSEAGAADADERGKVFAKNHILPVTFHVLSGWHRIMLEKMITVSPSSAASSDADGKDQGGGLLVPRSRASIIVDPNTDHEPEVWLSPDGSRAMVSSGWVLDCLATNKLVNLKMYAAREV